MSDHDDERREHERELIQAAYSQARGDWAADLRELSERFVAELRALRIELRRALGWPTPLRQLNPIRTRSWR